MLTLCSPAADTADILNVQKQRGIVCNGHRVTCFNLTDGSGIRGTVRHPMHHSAVNPQHNENKETCKNHKKKME